MNRIYLDPAARPWSAGSSRPWSVSYSKFGNPSIPRMGEGRTALDEPGSGWRPQSGRSGRDYLYGRRV